MVLGSIQNVFNQGEILKDLCTAQNMGLHHCVLFIGKTSDLIENGIGDSYFSYIMHLGSLTQIG